MSILNKRFYIPVILLIATLFVLLQSPLAPFANKVTGTDSSVFIYSAMEILHGKLIYKEIFDHKGPLIYIINIIGLKILNGNLTGIWIMEVISLLIAMLFIFKTLKLFVDDYIAVVSVLLLLLTLVPLLEGGNYSEEYALPFMAVSAYILTGYLAKQRVIKYFDILLVSVCFSMTFLLRPNLIPLWIGFAVVILISLIRDKNYKDIFRFSLLFAAGIFLTVLPFIWYALNKDILADAIFCIWKFNLAYSKSTLAAKISSTFMSTRYIDVTSLSKLVFIYLLYVILNFKKENNKLLHAAIFLNIALTMFISCGLSGRIYLHYSIAYIPVVSVAVAQFFSAIAKYGKAKIFTAGVMLILTNQVLVMNFSLIDTTYAPKPSATGLANFIKSASGKDDKIAIIGNDSKFYFMSERDSASKYQYLYPILEIDRYQNLILKEFCNDLITSTPKLIILADKVKSDMTGCIAETIERDYVLNSTINGGRYVIYSLK